MAKPATRATMEGIPQKSRTFFVSSATMGRRHLFQSEEPTRCFFRALFEYRNQGHYQVHEFVLMPDHFHLMLTVPSGTAIERAVQGVKGKSAYRLSHELGWKARVWQRGFTDHQITDPEDYFNHREYVRLNPVKRGLAASPEQYRLGSAYPGYRLDPAPAVSG